MFHAPLRLRALTVLMALQLVSLPAESASCHAVSGAVRVPLLELYTSEGCDSCPPANRWLSGLGQRGYAPDRILALALHVDYWNYLGWIDPFAQQHFSERQRERNRRAGSRIIYTPQLLLDGADYRRGLIRDDFAADVDTLRGRPPQARINLTLDSRENEVDLHAEFVRLKSASPTDAMAYIALFENDLATDVRAGENRGKRLQHDFVVRELRGPFAVNSVAPAGLQVTQTIRLAPEWKIADLHAAAFVESAATGRTLQALSLPVCR